MRLIFMGTPAFSVPTLQALKGAGHEIVTCYTQPPRAAGRRGLTITPSPVHAAANALDIPVRHPASLKSAEEQERFAALDADVAVVVAYGLLLPKPVLDAPRHGCFNGHASLLPRWRGAAPIQRAIMAGDTETGMMVMQMEEGLDTGPVAMTAKVAITPDMTGGELHDLLSQTGAALMVDAMTALEAGGLTLTAQPDEGVTYAAKIDKAETRIDFTGDAQDIHNRIRALAPMPGAWCEMQFGDRFERVKLLGSTRDGVPDGLAGAAPAITEDAAPLTIACGHGAIRLTHLQKAGGKPLDAQAFVRGHKPTDMR